MKNERKPFRHGDVLLIPVDKIDGEKQKDLILARGEVSGHSHQITEGNAALFKFNEKMYLKVKSKFALLSHEEHKALQIPQGEWEIKIQRDYEPKGWKRVED